MAEVLSWFDSISFYYVLGMMPLLVVLEPIVTRLVSSLNSRRFILISLWQVLGVLFPVLWLLRCSTNYYEVAVVLTIIAFFGVFKPTQLQNKNESPDAT
ncbi:hypothetical protein [Rheinheimera maricola]|uniref:Uncharacterized protein n=1 Tax=Rheinheimera maricola TaxID=2793282 RepID=A0ABS7XEL1_9GAMM|nr:hypothetical protein [Rheinheimera maricola]MBZ9613761.1 hypothetical protein [Rheinheimera maricola]